MEVREIGQVREGYRFARENGVGVFVLGEGSNVIGRDEGYDGVVMVNKLRGMEILREVGGEVVVRGYGGEMLDDFIGFGAKRGYSGMEAMSAIPGTLGAAPVQNVGAYGQEISQVVQWVEAYDSRDDNVVKITTDKMGLGYRKSIFNRGKDRGRYFIISVAVKLRRGRIEPPFYTSLQDYVDENGVVDFTPASIRQMVAKIRAEKLPDPKVVASAGSFFKNITLTDEEARAAEARGILVWKDGESGKNTVNSGWLIERAGLKGKKIDGFVVSDKAALILINESAKSYRDLARARAYIVGVVKEKFGFTLEQEPVEIV
jgi:UDP-N-acetylmuramate dehydrogenase